MREASTVWLSPDGAKTRKAASAMVAAPPPIIIFTRLVRPFFSTTRSMPLPETGRSSFFNVTTLMSSATFRRRRRARRT